jgi:WD40 repeat protein
MSRIFISHSSADDAAALALALWLEGEGWSDFFLDFDETRGISPGDRWVSALRAAVDRCEAVIFLVSPAWVASKYCFAEFFEAKTLGKRIFGVIVEPVAFEQLPPQMTAEWQVCDLSEPADNVSISVSKPPRISQTTVRFPRSGLRALATGLRRAGLDPATFLWPPEDEPNRSPYPGLRALDESDAGVFFGRDAAILRAMDRVRQIVDLNVERLFVILGSSGAGKSSFLRAGLLPRFKRDPDRYVVLPVIRPERAVISGAHGLIVSLREALACAGESTNSFAVRSELSTNGLAPMLRRIGHSRDATDAQDCRIGSTVLIPIDQAEELLGSDGGHEAHEFLSHLARLVGEPKRLEAKLESSLPLRVLFLFTLRSDSLPALQAVPSLQALSPVLFSLPPIPTTEFKAVVEGPARRHTEKTKPLVISPSLIEQLIIDAQGRDALPLLALTLEWLYREFTTQDGTRLGLEQYRQIGGVRGVINVAVERAFEHPSSQPIIPSDRQAQIQLLQEAFPYLATMDPDTSEWMRRVAVRSQLPAATKPLIQRLIEQRVLRTDVTWVGDEIGQVETIELAHEAILRQWDVLERWLKELGSALAACETIHKASNDWIRGARDDVLLLHSGHRLASAEDLLRDVRIEGRFGPRDREYLGACRRRARQLQEERESQLAEIAKQQAEIATQQSERARLQNRVKWGLTFAALILIGLGAWIVAQTRNVSRQESLVLAAAAERAADQGLFDQSLRLAVLAAKGSWLHPADDTAAPALSRAADSSMLRTMFGHSDRIRAARFSPDGRRVVTASDDHTARIWAAQTGNPIGYVMKHEGPVTSASFSFDGRRVVTTSDDGTARVWDADTGKPISEIMKHEGPVIFAAFISDSHRVITASDRVTVRVWDADTGKPIGNAMKHEGDLDFASPSHDGRRVIRVSDFSAVARVWDTETDTPVGEPLKQGSSLTEAHFSPDGSRVVTATIDYKARVWDVNSGKAIGKEIEHVSFINSAVFSPDRRRVVTASDDHTARIWDIETGNPVGEPMKHEASVNSAAFSPDGRLVVTASQDRTTRIWDAETGKPVGEILNHERAVRSATFSPDGQLVMTTSEDNMTRVWKIETEHPLAAAINNEKLPKSITFSADGRLLVIASDATARVWDVEMGKAIGEVMKHEQRVNSANFSPDGRRVVTASNDHSAHIWDTITGKPIGDAMHHQRAVNFAAFSPDGRRVVTASADDTARIWNADTGKPLGEVIKLEAGGSWANFSPDGRRILTASSFGVVRIWDGQTGKPVGEHSKLFFTASFSPDGRHVVAIAGNTARIWDAETDNAVGEVMTHKARVTSASFNPNGRLVVTASEDRTARVWDADTGKPVGEALNHKGTVNSASFSPDGRWVVTASDDGTARIWEVKTGKSIGEAMKHASRVYSATFSSDSGRVVTHSEDQTARVWDAKTGKLAGNAMNPAVSAKFSPDGRWVVTGFADMARIWDASWPLISRQSTLVPTVCRQKLLGDARRIFESDIQSAPIISKKLGEDVCLGVSESWFGPVR